MRKKNILVISSADLEAGDSDQYRFHFAGNDEQAIELAQQDVFDAIILEAISAEDKLKLKAILPILQPEALILTAGTSDEKEVLLADAFRERRKQQMVRLKVFDALGKMSFDELPPFSAN